MKTKSFLICLVFLVFSIKTYCQEETHALGFNISVSEDVRQSFNQMGRLFIFIGTNPNIEPRLQIWPNSIEGKYYLFAKNFSDWKANESLVIYDSEDWATWARTQECTFENIPKDTYYIQLLWDQDFENFGVNAPGNICSKKQEINLSADQTLNIKLSEIIKPFKLLDHKYVKLINHISDTLSKWWGRSVYERAAILLPSKYYENPGKEYPIRYNIGGGFGSLDRVNRLIKDTSFFNWWLSDNAPQIITVYLDGEINGNIYHINSDNKGPFGYSLIHEFIPYIENLYRRTDSLNTRFVDGCSTGGWGSLAMQLFYPEYFNGAFSYSPDPVSFWKYFTVNLYGDNMFYNEYGYEWPMMRDVWDNIHISIKDWVEFENTLGYSGTYIDSDHWFGMLSTLFGPKGADGKPVPLFDHLTGIIDTTLNNRVLGSWYRYDLSRYIMDNWSDIGKYLDNKIYIWMGTSDDAYLNNALRAFEYNCTQLKNPESTIIIEWTPNSGHCWQHSDKRVLEQIAEKLANMDME